METGTKSECRSGEWSGSKMIDAVVSKKDFTKAKERATSESRPLILIWARRPMVELHLRQANLLLSEEGLEALGRMFSDAPGKTERSTLLHGQRTAWIGHLPKEWVAAQLEAIVANPSNLQTEEEFLNAPRPLKVLVHVTA